MPVLNADNVREIVKLLEKGELHREIAVQFGVHTGCVGQIACGLNWRSVPEVLEYAARLRRGYTPRKAAPRIEKPVDTTPRPWLSQAQLVELPALAVLGEDQFVGQPDRTWDMGPRLNELSKIDPEGYFTAGVNAIEAANRLVNDLDSQLKKARNLQRILRKVRGDARYLECTWSRTPGVLVARIPLSRNRLKFQEV